MKIFECAYCGKLLTTRNGLIIHLKKCMICRSDGAKQVHKCSACDKQFGSRSGLFYHKTKIHKKVDICESSCSNVTKCTDCCREFLSSAAYQQHPIKCHNIDVKKAVECIYCPAVFASRAGRLIHTKKQHSQLYHDRCRSINENLRDHQLYSCFYCKKTFTRKTNRAKHEEVCKLSDKICEKSGCNLGNIGDQETPTREQDHETHLSPENLSGPSSICELEEISVGVEHGITDNSKIHSNDLLSDSLDSSCNSQLHHSSLNQIDFSALEQSGERINLIENQISTNVVTPSLKHYIRDRKPFMQLSTPDCITPRRSRINLEYGKATVKKLKRKIATLQQKNRRLEEKITTFHDLVRHLEKNNKISITAAESFMVLRCEY